MGKNIDIEYDGKVYTLEYTLESVKQMERAGFDVDAAMEKPVTNVDTLFTGAFLEHHGRAIKEGVPAKIMKENGLPKNMLTALTEMYREVLEMFIYDDDEREETGEKKLTWEKNF